MGRLLTLQPGLEEHFGSAFWMEEKIDGYNVRIFRIGEDVLALSRGGFVCPFTTDRAGDLMNLEVFEAEPDLVVCAEVAGPDNPYMESTAPDVHRDVALYVFDLMRLDVAGFLPQAEREDITRRHRLPRVTTYGRFGLADLDRIHQIVLKLNDESREGVVFKEDSTRDHRAKYVTSNSNILEIRNTAHNILDLPADYFTERVLRLVLFQGEQHLSRDRALDQRLGAAFIDGLEQAIQQFKHEQKVYRTFRSRFIQRANAEAMMAHLKRATTHQVHVRHRDLRREDGYWVLEFDRIYPRMNGLLQHLLAGGLVFD